MKATLSMVKNCKDCNKKIKVYDTITNRCPQCRLSQQKPKKRKSISRYGKRAKEYDRWRKEVAYPIVYEKQLGKCADTGVDLKYGQGDLHHIKGRGSHVKQKHDVNNLVLLTREAHQARHGIKWL